MVCLSCKSESITNIDGFVVSTLSHWDRHPLFFFPGGCDRDGSEGPADT